MDDKILNRLFSSESDVIIYRNENDDIHQSSCCSGSDTNFDDEESEKYVALKRENETLRRRLDEEQQRSNKYQKKVMYIQEHAELLTRLRQAYLSMKYNVSGGSSKNQTNVKEASCQTQTVTFERTDIDAIKDSLNAITEHVNSKPFARFLKDEREHKYKMDIITLYKDKIQLKHLLEEKQLQLDQLERNMIEKQLPIHSDSLNTVIAKLNINLKHSGGKCIIELTDMENKIVDHITEQYEIKVQSKNYF